MIALDATFRDGGYYNNWNFDIEMANRYLVAMEKAKVNAVEIGFRSPPKKEVGRFGKVTDYFIEDKLYIPDIEYFGVMINAKEFDFDTVKKLFCSAEDSPINLVRVAVHFDNIKDVQSILLKLKFLGYTTTINLMQAADKSYGQIRDAAKVIKKWGSVDVLYLADSLGGMDHDSVNYAFKAIREGWDGLIGFHGHNNKGQSLNNTLEAIDIDVDWVDSTMLGMGRGAGNTETEYLLNELNKRQSEFELEPIFELALQDFYKMKLEHNWGPSLPYYLAAEYNIHPTYIQKMLPKYHMRMILNAILFLKDEDSNSFNEELFKEAVNEYNLFDSCKE